MRAALECAARFFLLEELEARREGSLVRGVEFEAKKILESTFESRDLQMRAHLSLFTLAFLLFLFAPSAFAQSSTTPYDSVDPLIGTAGGGNTFPGATLPFGMVQWSPDTNTDAWYRYNEKQLYGFSLTHISGAGCPLYG